MLRSNKELTLTVTEFVVGLVTTIGLDGILSERTEGAVSETSVDDEEEIEEDDLVCEIRTGGWAGRRGEGALLVADGTAVNGEDPMVKTSWQRPVHLWSDSSNIGFN